MSTLISWSDEVWNPTTGCDRVSPGCANCYALTLAGRYRHNPKMQALGIYQRDGGKASGPGFGLALRPEVLSKPLGWKRPRRVFVNSMSDLFHEEIPFGYLLRVFNVMAQRPEHTFQILTKRMERARDALEVMDGHLRRAMEKGTPYVALAQAIRADEWPLRNVLIGPTVENQAMADRRLPVLANIKAMGWRTMVSYEPALGPVEISHWLPIAIDWLICGGESGPKRRPFDHAWARSVLQQARDAGVPFFMKQDGALRSEAYEDLPEELKVREFPR